MSRLFSLEAQKLGFNANVNAEADGLGITIFTDRGPLRAQSVNAAIRAARDYIGEFLEPASRGGVPWGLLVTVSDGMARYGDWPQFGGGAGSPSFRETPLVRIHQRWHDHGPISALENAIEIIHAYSRRPSRRRQAA